MDAGEDRHGWLMKLMQATGERTKTKALFVAARHYCKDRNNKERIGDSLTASQVGQLSTPELPMEREMETRVGRDSEE